MGVRTVAERRAGDGQEFPVAEHTGDPDGRIDVVAYAGPDVADVPGVAQALVENGDMYRRLSDND